MPRPLAAACRGNAWVEGHSVEAEVDYGRSRGATGAAGRSRAGQSGHRLDASARRAIGGDGWSLGGDPGAGARAPRLAGVPLRYTDAGRLPPPRPANPP